jgi:hypothetical protein
MNSPSTALLIVALFGATWSLGCQGQRATRYAVEGTVTFDGKPVPSGVIRFEPASGNGLIAPMGYARVATRPSSIKARARAGTSPK